MNFLPNLTQSWKLSFLGLPKVKMEDDLKNFKMEDDLKKFKMEDDLKNFKMEDDLKNFKMEPHKFHSLNFSQSWKLSSLGLPNVSKAKEKHRSHHTGSFMNLSVNSQSISTKVESQAP